MSAPTRTAPATKNFAIGKPATANATKLTATMIAANSPLFCGIRNGPGCGGVLWSFKDNKYDSPYPRESHFIPP